MVWTAFKKTDWNVELQTYEMNLCPKYSCMLRSCWSQTILIYCHWLTHIRTFLLINSWSSESSLCCVYHIIYIINIYIYICTYKYDNLSTSNFAILIWVCRDRFATAVVQSLTSSSVAPSCQIGGSRSWTLCRSGPGAKKKRVAG